MQTSLLLTMCLASVIYSRTISSRLPDEGQEICLERSLHKFKVEGVCCVVYGIVNVSLSLKTREWREDRTRRERKDDVPVYITRSGPVRQLLPPQLFIYKIVAHTHRESSSDETFLCYCSVGGVFIPLSRHSVRRVGRGGKEEELLGRNNIIPRPRAGKLRRGEIPGGRFSPPSLIIIIITPFLCLRVIHMSSGTSARLILRSLTARTIIRPKESL